MVEIVRQVGHLPELFTVTNTLNTYFLLPQYNQSIACCEREPVLTEDTGMLYMLHLKLLHSIFYEQMKHSSTKKTTFKTYVCAEIVMVLEITS
jgi:hypothetical protein